MKKIFKHLAIFTFTSTNAFVLLTNSYRLSSVQHTISEVHNNQQISTKMDFPTLDSTLYVLDLSNYEVKKTSVRNYLRTCGLVENIDYTLKVRASVVRVTPTAKYKNVIPIAITLIKAKNISTKFHGPNAKAIFLQKIPSEQEQKLKEITKYLLNFDLNTEDFTIEATTESNQFKVIGKGKYQREVIITLMEQIDFPRLATTLNVPDLNNRSLKRQVVKKYLSTFGLNEKIDYKLTFKRNRVLVTPTRKYITTAPILMTLTAAQNI